MLPALGRIEAAFTFLARRYALTMPFPEAAVRAALQDATTLVRSQGDEPAALYFALSARARALGALWPVLPALIAVNHAARLGVRIRYDDTILRPLRIRIAARAITFDETCAIIATLME